MKPRKPVVIDLRKYDPEGGWYDRALPFYQIDSRLMPPFEWLVKKMIPKVGVGVLVGRWGKSKTYLALDLARAVGTMTEYAGRKTQHCAVLYVGVDRPRQTSRRANFMMRHYGLKELPLFFIHECPPLKDGDALRTLSDTVHAINETSRVRVGLIIIDTLVVAAQWKDEGSSAEVQVALKTLRALSNDTNTFVLALDHTGKNEALGPRGSSDKQASTDILLTVHMADQCPTGHLEVTRSSDGPEGQRIEFERVVHDIGKDDDGEVITECTIRWGDEITRDQIARDAECDAVLTAISEGAGQSLETIARHANLQRNVVYRATQRMPDLVRLQKRVGWELTEAGRQRVIFLANSGGET